ncbi:hypothetical protein MKW92_003779 [Papaver armeniacum]|nr:hypothetical protein MKW92_003779 [Papaver armeniacum]
MATSKVKLPRSPKVACSTATSKVDLPAPASQKLVWRIENFSKLTNQQLYSHKFSFGSRNWRILLTKHTDIYPRLEIYLCPVDHTDSYFNYTLAVIDQKNDLKTVKTVKRRFNPSWTAYSHGLSLRLGEYYSPNNGYLLDDTCIVEVEISKARPKSKGVDVLFLTLACLFHLICCLSCLALGPFIKEPPYKIPVFMAMILATHSLGVAHLLPFLLYDSLEKKPFAPWPAKVIKLVSDVEVSKTALEKNHETGWKNHKAVEDKTQGKWQDKVPEIDPARSNQVESPDIGLVKHPGAGQIFEDGIHNSQASLLDEEDFEEIGGFSVCKSHASLYKQIWLKYGHIASSHVLTASSYLLQVMAVGDIMDSLLEMSRCRFVEVSSEKIGLWEGRIKTAENLLFNIEWLREHFDYVKQGFDEMQKLKTTLQEEAQPIKDAKARVTAAEDELKKVQEELTMAKAELNEKISASASRAGPVTFSESEFEMYLEKGDALLFDGVF